MKSSFHERKESKKLHNFERRLKKESSVKYSKNTPAAKFIQDKMKKIEARIKASRMRLNQLLSLKKNLAFFMENQQQEVSCSKYIINTALGYYNITHH